MRKTWHIFRRAAVLLLAALWLQTGAVWVVCHSDDSLCRHGGCPESTACTCCAHVAIEQVADAPFYSQPPAPVWVPATDETVRALLLPDDIFRPPLTNS